MDIERVLRSTPATLTVTFSTDESTADADGVVTVVVKRADGSTLSTGNAAHVGAAGSGQYSYNLAAQANLNNLTVYWTGTFSGSTGTVTSIVEVVGGHYFTIAELRGFDSSLADTTKYTTEQLQNARLNVEVEFERICQRAFVRRFAREIVEADGSDFVYTTHPELKSILTVNGVAVNDADYYTDGLYELHWPSNVFANGQRYTLEYEYGMEVCPVDIKRAALRRARGMLVGQRSKIDERATMMQVPDFGTFNLSTPGQKGAFTGIPDIDVVLNDYMLGRSGVH